MKSSFSPSAISNRISLLRSSTIEQAAAAATLDDTPTVARLLEQTISLDDTPFLTAQRNLPPVGLLRLDQPSIRIGEVLRQGEFTRTYAIAACRHLVNNTAMEEPATAQQPSNRKTSIIGKTGRAIKRSVASFDSTSNSATPKRRHAMDPLHYTIKLVHRSNTTDEQEDDNLPGRNRNRTQQQLLLEALYLSVLDHPGIVSLRAFPLWTSQTLFVLTDRIAETLEDRITLWRRQRRRARDPPQDTRRRRESPFQQEVQLVGQEDLVALKTNYALQIAHALEYLHARGIVVRELRPDTIGFLEYPHHHQVRLCDLSSAKELPMEGDGVLPSTEPLIPMDPDEGGIDNLQSELLSESSHHGSTLPSLQRSNTGSTVQSSFRRANSDASLPSSFRRTNSQPLPPTKNSPKTTLLGRRRASVQVPDRAGTDSSSHSQVSSGSSSNWSDREYCNSSSKSLLDWSAHSAKSSTPSSSSARNCYRAPELYAACATGYNAKADCYSWAMIFYELLADKRPTTRCHAETVEQLWQEIRTQRPSLKQCYFPLSIQQVVQQAWAANVSRRYSSVQIAKALTRVLPVLEGKRLDGTNRNGKQATPRSLPERAARVVNSPAAQGWNTIRKPHAIISSKQ